MSSLTKQSTIGYGSRVAGTIQRPGLEARLRGGRTAFLLIRRFFCVHSMAKLSCLGGAVREGATPAGPSPVCQPARSAHPSWQGGVRKHKPLVGAFHA